MSTVTPRRAETLEESSERRVLFCLWVGVRDCKVVGGGGRGGGGGAGRAGCGWTYCSRSYAADMVGEWMYLDGYRRVEGLSGVCRNMPRCLRKLRYLRYRIYTLVKYDSYFICFTMNR